MNSSAFPSLPAPGSSSLTENGAKAVSGDAFVCGASDESLGALLALNTEMVRDVPQEVAQTFLGKVCLDTRDEKEMFLRLIGFLRDTQDGKGERHCTYQLLQWFLEEKTDVTTVLAVLRLLPISVDEGKPLGYYGDWRQFHLFLVENGMMDELWFASFEAELVDLLATRLRRDEAIVDGYLAALAEDPEASVPSITLACKWAPVLGRKFGLLASRLSNYMFSNMKFDRQKAYRQMLSKLRSHKSLNLVETLMTEGRWDEIDPSAVPAKAMKKYRKAFQLTEESSDPGKAIFWAKLSAILEGRSDRTLKTSGLQLYELVSQYVRGGSKDAVVETQIDTIVKDMRKLVVEETFPVSVAIVDVSGSMSGVPMEVAVSLGLLLANIMPGVWGGRMITFESSPRWHTVDVSADYHSQVNRIMEAPWGGSTSFEAALKLVMEVAGEPRFMPEMFFCFTDMQFDVCSGRREKRNPIDAARVMYQENGFELPQVVFWNLRASGTGSFAAPADAKGVAMLSGFSQSLFKGFMSGDLSNLTPLGMFRDQLMSRRYDLLGAVAFKF